MIILATNSHYLIYSLKGWENVLFELGSERVNALCSSLIMTDTIHPMNFDWTRSDIEPLWLYEHVQAAKWSVKEVANFIRYSIELVPVLHSGRSNR